MIDQYGYDIEPPESKPSRWRYLLAAGIAIVGLLGLFGLWSDSGRTYPPPEVNSGLVELVNDLVFKLQMAYESMATQGSIESIMLGIGFMLSLCAPIAVVTFYIYVNRR